jgi:hypothetical protein
MKYFRYILYFLAGVAVAMVVSYVFYQIHNKGGIKILSPEADIVTSNNTSFSLENAPTESLKGEISTMSGKINWQGRTATEAARILSPITIQQGENLITGENSSLGLTFSDVCSVKLAEKTEVDIVQTLPANIVFSQTGGTSEYIRTGTYPVSVRANKLLTKIDGDITISFDINKPIITVSVISGNATAAFDDLKYLSHEVIISTGQKYIFNYGTRKGVLK